jgi:LppX/LprAFG-like lipoprotein
MRKEGKKRLTLASGWIGAVCACLLLLAACGGSSAPSSAALLKTAQDKFNTTQSMHFVVNAEHLGTPTGNDADVQSADGDVARPDKLKAKATVVTSFITVDVQLILIGAQGWYTNPLTGNFEQTDQFNGFQVLFDPTKGIGAQLTALKNPSAPTDGSANGVACWKISGTLPASTVGQYVGAANASGDIPVTVCLGKDDGRLHQIILRGVLTAHDTDQTVRTILFSDFDKPVTIEPPTV